MIEKIYVNAPSFHFAGEQNDICALKGSDQPAQPRSLVIIFAVRRKKLWDAGYSYRTQGLI